MRRAGTHLSTREIGARCAELLRMVGLDGKADARPRDLTQIEMRKLELARAMAAEPKLLIADEAMAGLSHSEVDDILALLLQLNEQGITIILIEHIMRAVMSFSAAPRRARRRPQDRRRRCRRRSCATPKSSEPILASSLAHRAALAPATARCACSRTCRSRSSSGETVALLGTNGNGKSTLMKCIMGMVRPSAGSIVAEIDGKRARADGSSPPRRSSISASRWCRRDGGCFRS